MAIYAISTWDYLQKLTSGIIMNDCWNVIRPSKKGVGFYLFLVSVFSFFFFFLNVIRKQKKCFKCVGRWDVQAFFQLSFSDGMRRKVVLMLSDAKKYSQLWRHFFKVVAAFPAR